MRRRTGLVLVFFLVVSLSLFSAPSERWVNTSLAFDALQPSEQSLGADVSLFLFPGNSPIGFASRFSSSFSLSASPAFSRLAFFVAPAFREVLAGGIEGYFLLGPSYTEYQTVEAVASVTQDFGIGADVGVRFRLSNAEYFDFALVVGVFGEASYLHLINGARQDDWPMHVVPYLGFSFGSWYFHPPFVLYQPYYTFS
jgi:hypothetical protein